jgi:hypothetical protein
MSDLDLISIIHDQHRGIITGFWCRHRTDWCIHRTALNTHPLYREKPDIPSISMLATPFDLFIRMLLLGFALILSAISTSAYLRYREGRLLLVAVAFYGFVLLSVAALVSSLLDIDRYEVDNIYVLVDLAILLVMYLGILKR